MCDRQKHKYMFLTLLFSAFLLLISVLPHAEACLTPEQTCSALSQVNSCHTVYQATQPQKSCCKSEACHTSTPVPRDIGSPSYHTALDASHPLAHDPRCPSPNYPLSGIAELSFSRSSLNKYHKQPHDLPNQSLAKLRTVVLRH